MTFWSRREQYSRLCFAVSDILVEAGVAGLGALLLLQVVARARVLLVGGLVSGAAVEGAHGAVAGVQGALGVAARHWRQLAREVVGSRAVAR